LPCVKFSLPNNIPIWRKKYKLQSAENEKGSQIFLGQFFVFAAIVRLDSEMRPSTYETKRDSTVKSAALSFSFITDYTV